MSCDNYPSKKDVEDFALNAKVINEFTTATGELTPSAASDGKNKITLAEIWRQANEKSITEAFLYDHTWSEWEEGGTAIDGAHYRYVWSSGKITLFSTVSGDQVMGATPDFSKFKVTSRSVDVMDYGAMIDGVTDDYLAVQACIDNQSVISIPDGVCYVSQPLKLPYLPSFTGFSVFKDAKILHGNYETSVITRKKENGTQAGTESELLTQPVIIVSGQGHTIKDLAIRDSDIGIWLGQHPDDTINSYVTRITLDRLSISRCGTGVLCSDDSGITYSKFDNLHIFECQVGFRSQQGRNAGSYYFNRNKFYNIRFSRCWAGLWLSRSDTCTFYSVDAEGCTSSGAVASGRLRPNLPAEIPEGVAVGLLFDQTYIARIFGSMLEGNDVDIADISASDNEYYGINTSYGFDHESALIFNTKPAVFLSHYIHRLSGITQSSNTWEFDPACIGGAINFSKEKATFFHNELPEMRGQSYVTRNGNEISYSNIVNLGAITDSVSHAHKNAGLIKVSGKLKFTITAQNSNDLTMAVLEGEAIFMHRSTSSSLARVRLTKSDMQGYSLGGGTLSDDTNTKYLTVALSVNADSDLQFDFSNLTGYDFDSATLAYSFAGVRGDL